MTSTSTTSQVNKTKFWACYLVTFGFFFFAPTSIGQIVPSIWVLFTIGFLFLPVIKLIFPWRHSKFDLGPDYLGFKYRYLPMMMAGLFALIAVMLMLNGQGQSARIYHFAAFAGFCSWVCVEQLRIWFKLQKLSASNE